MDNGHHNAIFSSNPDVDDNLNEENWQKSLEISAPAGMPTPEELGASEDIASTEDAGLYSAENAVTPDYSTPTPQEAQSINTPENLPELGQITPINQPKITTGQVAQKYNPVNIKTTGDKLEKSTIPEIDNIISELNQTGNLSNFYDEIRGSDEKPGMMEANLQNSYGRKLGEGA